MTKSAENITCQHFEAELSAFVDGELQQLHMQRVMAHLDSCSACRSYVDQLRLFAQMHRDSYSTEEILKTVDGPGIFNNITASLLTEKVDKIAELFYQIGKAYVLKGAREKRKGLRTAPLTRPKPITQSTQKAKSLLNETGELSKLNGDYDNVLKKARFFFKKDNKAQADRLAIGRRFLEQSLVINTDKAEPRIYLGFSFMVTRRYEQAREQFRKVNALPTVSEENRMIALQNLGFLFVIEKKYNDAVACFREIEKSGIITKQPKFFTVLTSLAMSYAKVGNYEKSIEYFKKIVNDFPAKVVEVRKELHSMETFQKLIRTQQVFRETLEKRLPALFAS